MQTDEDKCQSTLCVTIINSAIGQLLGIAALPTMSCLREKYHENKRCK